MFVPDWYIGIDVHKKKCWAVAKTKDGTVLFRRKFPNTPDGWRRGFRGVPAGTRVAIECVSWYYGIVEFLEELDMDPVLAHARNVDLIAKSKKKRDQWDAEVLCDLLRTGFLPTAYVPSKTGRALRDIMTQHKGIVERIGAAKNRVHRLLEQAWVDTPDVSDLFGKKGLQWLRNVELEPVRRVLLNTHLDELDTLTTTRNDLEAAAAYLVQDDEDVELLLSLTSVGVATSIAAKAQIDDVSRFPNRGRIRSNFGLAVAMRDTGETERRGGITKQGSTLMRKYLGQTALQFSRRDPATKKLYKRLKKQRGSGVALTAAAGRVLNTMYQVLKTREPYHHVDHELWQRKKRELARLAERGEQLLLT